MKFVVIAKAFGKVWFKEKGKPTADAEVIGGKLVLLTISLEVTLYI